MSQSNRPGNASAISDVDYEGDGDVSVVAEDFACPIGQQLIGVLLGFLLAYVAFLCEGANVVIISCALAIGSTFGSLAAAVSNPVDITAREFSTIFIISMIICCVCFTIFGAGNMLGILAVSVFNSAISLSIRSFLHYSGLIEKKNPYQTKTSDD